VQRGSVVRHAVEHHLNEQIPAAKVPKRGGGVVPGLAKLPKGGPGCVAALPKLAHVVVRQVLLCAPLHLAVVERRKLKLKAATESCS
jgi:hypothetical protein